MPELQTQMDALTALRGYRGQQLSDGGHPEAAVMVPLMAHPQGLSVLLTKRAPHLKLHAGEAAFPGGKRDPEDPDLLYTALREAQEEIDLPPSAFEWLFTLDQRVTRTDIKVTPFVGLVPIDVPVSANPNEIDEVFTVPLTHFMDASNITMVELPYHGSLISSPSFRYGQHTIWGVTAMTLIDLVNTVFDVGIEIS